MPETTIAEVDTIPGMYNFISNLCFSLHCLTRLWKIMIKYLITSIFFGVIP